MEDFSQPAKPNLNELGEPDIFTDLGKTKVVKRPNMSKLALLLGIPALILVLILAYGFYMQGNGNIPQTNPAGVTVEPNLSFGIKKFVSDQEFKDYFAKSNDSSAGLSLMGVTGSIGQLETRSDTGTSVTPDATLSTPNAPAADKTQGLGGGAGEDVYRVSETNVQVKGIDEPDIVKTDGKSIFLSTYFNYYRGFELPMPVMSEDSKIVAPNYIDSYHTKVIDALPPENLSQLSKIDKTGELLLINNKLIVFSGNDVFAYDVTNRSNPTQSWQIDFDEKQQVLEARLMGNKIYVVTSTYTYESSPCPIPLVTGSITLPCTDIYRPDMSVPVDSTYSVMVINSDSGTIEKKVGFVGNSGSGIIYMSPNAIYVSYSVPGDFVTLMSDFLVNFASDLIPPSNLERIRALPNLNISSAAKMTELSVLMDEWMASMNSDDRLKFETEYENRFSDYLKSRIRQLSSTGIVKITNNNLEVSSTGSVPGALLNQFSLDEYEGNLRMATTISSIFGNTESVNDVYVLDDSMRIIGQVQGLGITERIYSTRFVGDKGYIVTFRQIDPFYVLDLSNPKKPTLAGELKIPGFSSYLHPIDKNKIVGIGQDNNKVKISLFNVTNPQSPIESDTYLLDEYYTEVQNNHHAFLMDSQKGVFFLPGGRGGYILSYANDTLSLVKAVADISAQRAIYINNYFYVIGTDKIKVLDSSKDYEEVKSLVF